MEFLSVTGALGSGSHRPGGNAAALSSPLTASSFRELFCAMENGSMPVNTFRARIVSLGINETPEATRLLTQPTRIGFAALTSALRRGGAEDGLVMPSAGMGPGAMPAGARARSTVIESDIDSNVRALTKAREDRTSAQIESGAGALLRGQGDKLPPGATSDLSPLAPLSQHHHTARQDRGYDQIESGAGALLRNDAASLPSRDADGARARARALLAAVEGGGLREAEAMARFSDAGLPPSAIPGLSSSLRNYFNGGRVDATSAMRAVDSYLAERLPQNSDLLSGEIAGALKGMHTFRSPRPREGPEAAACGIIPVSRDAEPSPAPDRFAAARARALGDSIGWGAGSLNPPPPLRTSAGAAAAALRPPPFNTDARATSAAAEWGRPLGGPLSPHAGPVRKDTPERMSQRRADAREIAGQVERGKELRAASTIESLIGAERSAMHVKETAGYQFKV